MNADRDDHIELHPDVRAKLGQARENAASRHRELIWVLIPSDAPDKLLTIGCAFGREGVDTDSIRRLHTGDVRGRAFELWVADKPKVVLV